MHRTSAVSVALLLISGCPQDSSSSASSKAAASAPASAPATAAVSQPSPSSKPALSGVAVDAKDVLVIGGDAGFAGANKHDTSAKGPVPARFNKPIRLEPFAKASLGETGGLPSIGVFVADISNHAARHLTVSGSRSVISVLTLAGKPDEAGHRDNPTGEGPYPLLNAPHGVAALSVDTVVIAEASNHTLRSATHTGVNAADNQWQVTTIAGKAGEAGFVDGTADEALFASPHGICAHGDALYVADIGNKRLRRLKSGTVTTVAGTGEGGAADGGLDTGTMTAPIDVFCDKDGSVLIADAGAMSIRRWREGEGLSTLPVDRALKVPHSVTVDDNGRILVAELDGNVITDITDGKAKVVWGTGAAGSGPEQLNRPADVLAHGGFLWVADLGNHQVKQLPWP